MLAALVAEKKRLDRAAHAIELYRRMCSGEGDAGHSNFTSAVRVFDEAHKAFDARVAAMTEDERWQFMFTAMLTGALEDDFETNQLGV